jgi:hypothetical protein
VSNRDYIIRGLIVCCQCSDGKLRTVRFGPRQADRVFHHLKNMQGGRLVVFPDPVALVQLEETNSQPAPLTRWQRFVRFWKRISTSSPEINGPQPSAAATTS